MMLPVAAVVCGLALLVWSADRFVESAAGIARHFGVPPLLIGMVIVGFGTSAPEMVVSALAAMQGNPGIALGNAYGSNIANIALILGLTALVSPIVVHSRVLTKELPILACMTVLAAWQLKDGIVSRNDAIVLLVVFAVVMSWAIWQGLRKNEDALGIEIDQELAARAMPLPKATLWLIVGVLMLMASSRMLVWGAVEIARSFGVSDLVIGLTVVAFGTSLPELASSLIAARKGEHDIAVGNVIGSNMFNTLTVVGIAGAIHPIEAGPEVFARDIPVMSVLTLLLFVSGYGFGGSGRINRLEGGILLGIYCGYVGYLVQSVFSTSS